MPQKLLYPVAVALTAIVLRLLLIADQPYSDEGYYAVEGYVMHLFYTGSVNVEGWLLPREGILALYPLLTSWIHYLPLEPTLGMRAIDALVAAAAGVAVFLFISSVVEDRRIALVSALLFVVCANHPLFVNAGFKNPIMAALFLTALSLACLERVDARRSRWAGMLMAGAVLCREFFLPVGGVVSLYAAARGGWYCFWRFAASGAALGLAVISTILILRGPGSFEGLLTGYAEAGAQPGFSFSFERAFDEGIDAGKVLLPILPAAIAGLLAPLFGGARGDAKSLHLYLLGIALSLAPFLEILQKPVHAYHYGQAILGLTILCALGLRAVLDWVARRGRPGVAPALVCAFFLAGASGLSLLQYARTFYWQVHNAMRFAPVMIQGNWKHESTGHSFYLQAARTIRENSAPTATLMIAYYARGMLLLTGRRPTDVAAGDLTRLLTRSDRHAMRHEQHRLLRSPPDVLMIIYRTDPQGSFYAHDEAFTRQLSATYSPACASAARLDPVRLMVGGHLLSLMLPARHTRLPRLPWFLTALLVYCAIAVSLSGPALLGRGSLIAEGWIDRDPVFTPEKPRAHVRPYIDAAPAMIELAREASFAHALREGRIETWNPWSGAGSPLWAEQGGPFFPTKAIYYLYPSHATLMASLAARLVLAALGMFFLARALGMSRPAALFTGAVFEYSGILMAELAFMAFSATYMLPWVLLAAHKIATERGAGAVAFGGVALGVTALGGQPSLILVVFVGFAAWLLGEWAQSRPPLKELARSAGLAAAAAALGFLIAAVGLMPFLELVWHGHSYKFDPVSEVLWQQFLGMTRAVFAPALILPSLVTAARDVMPDWYWPWAAGASIGLVALLLAVAGARKLGAHWAPVLLAVVGVGLTLAPPGLQWLHALPAVRFVVPWYCYPLVMTPVCLAAGFGLQAIAESSRRRALLVPLGAVLGAVAFLWLALYVGVDAFSGVKQSIVDSVFYQDVLRGDLSHLNRWRLLVSPAAALFAVAAYVLLCRKRPVHAAAIVAVVAVAEAAVVRIPTVIFERSVALSSPPSEARMRLQKLLDGGSWRFTGVPPLRAAAPNTGHLFELRDLRAGAALGVARHVRFLTLAGPRSEDPWKRPEWLYPVAVKPPMLGLAAVRYVVYTRRYLEEPNPDVPPGLKELGAIGNVVLFENPLALPRFRIARDVVAVENEEQAFETLQRLLNETSAGGSADWARRVVIETRGSVPPRPAHRTEAAGVRRLEDAQASSSKPRLTLGQEGTSSEARTPSASESVRLISEPDPQTVVLEATLDTPGYVIVADTYYPGWSATIDGAPAIVHPANLLFRAVHVPAGRHTIVMKYQSTWLRTGAILTLLGLLLAAALLVRARPGKPA